MSTVLAIPVTQTPTEERAARGSLRAQVDRLERRLGALAYELGTSGRAIALSDAPAPARFAKPRILDLAELETTRDRLVARVCAAEQQLRRCVDDEAAAREQLEAMVADPTRYRFAVVQLADLGQPGCGAYQVRPRLGVLGMLFDWWCVKLSSGCP